ncbi:MAG: PVC-type heme-binding CxxCH protein, partial [Pirellulales bacterium]
MHSQSPPRSNLIALLLCASLIGLWPAAALAQEPPPIEHPPPHSPQEAEKLFKVPDGLQIRLVASEPQLSQPLSISFDDRGRMWLLEYLQYPIPEGLEPVEVDQYLRTRYNTVPKPPPHGPKGRDRISIFEDADGDGRSDTVKRFVSDLNLASGMALAGDGVYVVQPPYLLFYPDRDRDDLPDSDPDVLLSGFGMDDAHAFANSLTWGPDGWLYGAQGSTVTANIRGIEFQQGAWRYHPRTNEFELFAEGGGNSWGIDFDQFGNLFAAGNTVEPLVHHVQGAYYVKGFGKHGPLHNPHAYGYFLPVKHHGYAGDSLTGGYVLYQGGAFPPRFDGACIAPNTRHSASRWSTLETAGSTFATRAAGDFITTSDIWFRPVDSTVGPDGALYVADWYDYNISHSNPQNRSKWYMPSRGDGRVWRVAPADVVPVRSRAIDLAQRSGDELVELLSHPNDWYARQARRILAERPDVSLLPRLENMALTAENQRLALQALWSIYVIGGLDDPLVANLLDSPHEYVRAWTVRLLGDSRTVSPTVHPRLVQMAREEQSVVVRSQLACTAKRLPAEQAIPIVRRLLAHDEDAADLHVPLLVWWAIEDKAVTHPALVLDLVASPDAWRLPLVEQFIAERLARRYAAEGTQDSFEACAKLLALAPAKADTDRLLAGFVAALSGRRLESVPEPLATPLAKLLDERGHDPGIVQLALRLGHAEALGLAADLIHDRSLDDDARVDLVQTLGEIRAESTLDRLLELLDAGGTDQLHHAR